MMARFSEAFAAAAVLLCVAGWRVAAALELAERHHAFNGHHPRLTGATRSGAGFNEMPCNEGWFTQTIDHFSWQAPPTGSYTYQQRYFWNDTYWNKANGCVFFYAGNEADVTLYRDHTGLMWENAQEFGAMLIFAEHRYYGKSQPFGHATQKYMQYLTHEQAMADYATLVYNLAQQLGFGDQPVILFGGSYGGMLAAWTRNKYPSAFAGAIAASAPILAFMNMDPAYDSETYWQVVTADATAAAGSAAACAANVRASWPIMFAAAQSPQGLANLTATFSICTPLQSARDVEYLAMLELNAWDTLAMGNFPYPSNYLTGGGPNLPAWPVRAACDALADATLVNDPWRLLAAFRTATDVFNNATQDVQCYALPTDFFQDGIWDYEWCTEMLPEETYFGMNGQNDMFWSRPYNFTFIQHHCHSKYGVTPRADWIRIAYGGLHTGSSNIVFSNGMFDPWSSGGIKTNLSSSLQAVLIEEGAHHIDLFFSDPADPPSVTNARLFEMANVRLWVDEHYAVRGKQASAAKKGSSRA